MAKIFIPVSQSLSQYTMYAPFHITVKEFQFLITKFFNAVCK